MAWVAPAGMTSGLLSGQELVGTLSTSGAKAAKLPVCTGVAVTAAQPGVGDGVVVVPLTLEVNAPSVPLSKPSLSSGTSAQAVAVGVAGMVGVMVAVGVEVFDGVKVLVGVSTTGQSVVPRRNPTR